MAKFLATGVILAAAWFGWTMTHLLIIPIVIVVLGLAMYWLAER